MKLLKLKLLCLFFCISTTFSTTVFAQGGPFGLGLVIGAPTGLTGKYFLNRINAIDGALAWDMGSDSSFLLQSTYLWHKFNFFQIDAQPIDLYFGVGGRIASRNRPHTHESEDVLGIRAPVGLRHYFRQVPIEVFLETALTLYIIPRSSLDLDLGIGGRYYF